MSDTESCNRLHQSCYIAPTFLTGTLTMEFFDPTSNLLMTMRMAFADVQGCVVSLSSYRSLW